MSTKDCPLLGTADVAVDFDRQTLVWSRADLYVHVHDAVLQDDVAFRRFSTMYEVEEKCPHGTTAWHARRRLDGIRASDLTVVDAGVAEALDRIVGGAA